LKDLRLCSSKLAEQNQDQHKAGAIAAEPIRAIAAVFMLAQR
jgi:hypothetical protein